MMVRQGLAPLRAVLVTVLACLAVAPAWAHPHVFVTAKSEVLFGANGLVTGIRHSWKFDDMYSAFIVQGIGEPGQALTREQLAPLAKTNIESLAEFKYFTVAKVAGKDAEFGAPTDFWNEQAADKSLTLHFTLPLKTPVNAPKLMILLVYDPTYFVAFSLDDKDPVTLMSPPAGCSTSLSKPKPLEAADKQKLTESFFTNLSPGTDFGLKLAARAIIACP